MLFFNVIKKIFEDSSIHGFPYVPRRDFHILERIFWIATLSLSIYCAYEAFSGQLKRYEENPTVLSVDIVSYEEFQKPAFTVCTRNYTNLTQAAVIIERMFNVNSDTHSNYSTYVRFVHDVLNTTYLNFENLKKYKGIEAFETANFLEIASELESFIPLVASNYRKIMTELGICQTSSNYSRYQSPHLMNVSEYFNNVTETCTTLEVCRASVSPGNALNQTFNEVYINGFGEVTSGDDLDYVLLRGTTIKERSVKIEEIRADPAIRQFKPKSRKCRFVDEPNSDYFDIYTQNLCKIDCRIKRAKEFCGCVPYFYTFPLSRKKLGKICNITEMICLAEKHNWFDATPCRCLNLCESTILTKLNVKMQNLQFDRMLTVDLTYPKTRILRSVVFDFDDLIVGLGGSVALFLGFSFLCAVESFFICIQAIINLGKS